MVKCASCEQEKPDSAFSKTQLVKGSNARCLDCTGGGTPSAAGTTESAGGPSPTKTKTCSVCNRAGVAFSKAQAKKPDGKCVDCVAASEGAAAPAATPSTAAPPPAQESKKDVAPEPAKPVPQQQPAAQASSPRHEPSTPAAEAEEQKPEGEDEDSLRISCQSCAVFKPPRSFSGASPFCKTCAEAKRRGSRTTTMQDHGLVGKDGMSHRKLSWVPDGLKEWLAFMDESAQEDAYMKQARQQAEDEDDGEPDDMDDEYGYAEDPE